MERPFEPARPGGTQAAAAALPTTPSLPSALTFAERVSRHAATLGWLLLRLGLLLPAQSLLWAQSAPLPMKLSAVAIAALGYARPQWGLLIVAALAPLGGVLGTVWQASPIRVAEALVLAFLAGWVLRERLDHHEPSATSALGRAMALFGVAVAASCVVQLAVLQVWRDYPWPFAQRVLTFVTLDYLETPGEMRFVATTALLIEGLLLLAAVVAVCRAHPATPRRLTRMVAVGALGAAALSILQVSMLLVGAEDPAASFQASLAGRWTTMHIGDVNAAGSYFLLVGAATLGAAMSARRRRALWIVTTLTIGLALWLTGSRAAVLTSIMLAGGGLVALAVRRYGRRGALGALVTAAAVVLLLASLPIDLIRPGALTDLNIRLMFLETSLRMFASEPIFGVGIGQYYLWSAHFSPPELLAVYPRENAHNYFLQIAAELGLVGIALFTGVIATAAWRIQRGLRCAVDWRLTGLACGLVGFLATCLTGHPLLVPEVAYPFWVLLGLAVSLGDRIAGEAAKRSPISSQPVGNPAGPMRARVASGGVLAGLAGILLVGLIPAQVLLSVEQIDLSRVDYGFHGWEEESSGTRFRWTTRRASFFVSGQTRAVVIPLRAYRPDATADPFRVEVALNGVVTERVDLSDNRWHQLQLTIPPGDARRFHRVDVWIDRTWSPTDVLPGSRDTRELGVKLGELELLGSR